MLSIIPTLTRTSAVRSAAPDRHSGLRAVAHTLDRRIYDQAQIELVTEALHRLAELAYAPDRLGYVNLDGATGRLLIPAPMGKAGQRHWSLYPSESNALRAILRSRQRRKGHTPLYVYDPGRRAWCVNLAAYPDLGAALAYLEQHPITLAEWRHFRAKTKRKG